MGFKPRVLKTPPGRIPGIKNLAGKPGKQFYIVRTDDQGSFAFIPHPTTSGIYIKTDISVALVPCFCGSAAGEPCRGAQFQYTVGTHADRKGAAIRLRQEIKRLKGFVLTGKERIIYPKDLDD